MNISFDGVIKTLLLLLPVITLLFPDWLMFCPIIARTCGTAALKHRNVQNGSRVTLRRVPTDVAHAWHQTNSVAELNYP